MRHQLPVFAAVFTQQPPEQANVDFEIIRSIRFDAREVVLAAPEQRQLPDRFTTVGLWHVDRRDKSFSQRLVTLAHAIFRIAAGSGFLLLCQP